MPCRTKQPLLPQRPYSAVGSTGPWPSLIESILKGALICQKPPCHCFSQRRMLTLIAFALLILCGFTQQLLAAPVPEIEDTFRKSIVRITANAQVSDYNTPWNPGHLIGGTGSGFLISGEQILTNAHVVSNARVIRVEKEGDARQYEARVKFIAHDCDLAVLTVLDINFVDGMVPLALGDVPSLDSTVTVVGYPIGGDRLSVTRGVVSRIDFQRYTHSSIDLHSAIQIDAAINPGNSGGPVIQDKKVIGVAFQGYSGDVAQNTGYMIPVPVIRRFLKDIEDGQYNRYVDMATSYFPLINPAYRRAMGLEDGDVGVVVTSVMKVGAANELLQPNDILLAIDGFPIYSNGSVEIDGERVNMAEVVERKFSGDLVKLKILRAGKEQNVELTLTSPWPFLNHASRYEVKPQFIVFGGLVFQPLSQDLIKARQDIKNINTLYYYDLFIQKEFYLERPEIVILSRILPDPINTHVSEFTTSIVEEINGRKIHMLRDVSEAFGMDVEYHVIRLLGYGRPIVLEHKEVEQARQRILSRYGVVKEEQIGDSIVPEDFVIAPDKT